MSESAGPLAGKTILLGVTGGIGAYKACEIIREMTLRKAEVHVVMTEAGTKFITPLTLRTLSEHPVHTNLWADESPWDMEQHITLSEKPDLLLVAPATADFLGKVANGLADDLLSATIMATLKPVAFAPAMNVNMYNNPLVQANLETLKRAGYHFIGPAEGRLASGAYGLGRLEDPLKIVKWVEDFFRAS